jgi:hypothetical protein
MLVAVSISVSAATIVRDIFQDTYTVDATNYPFNSCNVDANWQAGSCSYLYACSVVVPKGSYNLNDALAKECIDITDSKKTDLSVTFAPPRGNRYAVVTFLVDIKKTYNPTTFLWSEEVIIPNDYRQAEQAISLCPEGSMLNDNLCYEAQPVCLDKYLTNLCDNAYMLYVLDYGTGFDMNNPAHYCGDRDKDYICDETTSYLCPDVNSNGVCDADDVEIKDSACIDNNKNFICDNVETNGTFCRTYYEPVSVGTGTSCVTYPNSCFAIAAGFTNYVNGTCNPVYNDYCFSNADCNALNLCEGVTGICKNYGEGRICEPAGECTKMQCQVDADCPSSPCVGVSYTCNTFNYMCTPVGKCISKPVNNPSFWAMLLEYLRNFISSVFT